MEPLLSSAAYGLLWDQKSRFIKRNTCENASAAYIRACVSERSTAVALPPFKRQIASPLPVQGETLLSKRNVLSRHVCTLRDPAEVSLGEKLYTLCLITFLRMPKCTKKKLLVTHRSMCVYRVRDHTSQSFTSYYISDETWKFQQKAVNPSSSSSCAKMCLRLFNLAI